MPVDLSPDLQASVAWRGVANLLAAELAARGIGDWTVSIRGDAGPGPTSTDGLVVDRAARRVTIDVPGDADPGRPADEQAFAWADDVGLLVEGEPGEPA